MIDWEQKYDHYVSQALQNIVSKLVLDSLRFMWVLQPDPW
jgi:hypothetical protein